MTSTLTKVAVFGCVASVAGAAVLTGKIHANLQREEYFQKPVAMLRKYGPAVEYLGQPIRFGRMDLGDLNKNCIDGLNAKLTIPVKGPKDKGTLYAWASREKAGDSWEVGRLDLEVEKLNTRWTFYAKNGLKGATENGDDITQMDKDITRYSEKT